MRYPAKKSKYHSKKTACNFGHIHDSKSEAFRCDTLNMLQAVGKITDLQTQVKFVLIPAQRERSTEFYKRGEHKGEAKPGRVIETECAYYADFVYKRDGVQVVEDVKGMKNGGAYELYKIKRKLMLERYGIRIVEV